MDTRNYSRLNRVTEEKARKSALIYIVATVAFVIFLVAFGPSLLSRLTSLFMSSKPEQTSITDKTPPPPPTFKDYPTIVNSESMSLEGSAEPQSTVFVNVDDRIEQILVDSDGNFNLPITLSEGENTISATCTDPAGNKSLKSEVLDITLDKTPPDLTLSSPTDGQTFTGKNKTISIVGTTSADILTINDHIAIIGNSGNFSYSYTLNEGENKLALTAKDNAQNETKVELTVYYNP